MATNNTTASNSTNGLATTNYVVFTIERRAEQSNTSVQETSVLKLLKLDNQLCECVLPDRMAGCIAESLPETLNSPLESTNGCNLVSELLDGIDFFILRFSISYAAYEEDNQ